MFVVLHGFFFAAGICKFVHGATVPNFRWQTPLSGRLYYLAAEFLVIVVLVTLQHVLPHLVFLSFVCLVNITVMI
jgi:hypothetical protein